MLIVTPRIRVPAPEIELSSIRAQGSGGQNVNKVSNAVHLRFDIRASSLPEEIKERLAQIKDHRVTKDGIVIIKAQQYRSLEQNREDALVRLADLIRRVAVLPPKRKPTKPTRGSKQRRLEGKVQRARIKALRGRVTD